MADETIPTGVILQGSIGPMSRRINMWCAHFGQTLIVDGARKRKSAIAAANKWYESTTDARRAEMLFADAAEEKKNVVRRASLLMREAGDVALADACDAFADTICATMLR